MQLFSNGKTSCLHLSEPATESAALDRISDIKGMIAARTWSVPSSAILKEFICIQLFIDPNQIKFSSFKMNLRVCTVLSVLFVLLNVAESRVNILDVYRKEVFDYAVLRNQRPVVVYFTKSSCGVCSAVRENLEKFARDNSKVMDVAIVDLDKKPELREHFGVKAIPTTRAYRKGVQEGEVKGPGWVSIKKLAEALIEQ